MSVFDPALLPGNYAVLRICSHPYLWEFWGPGHILDVTSYLTEYHSEVFPVVYQVLFIAMVSVPLPAALKSWGPSFSYSVWYVELRGVMEEARVGEARRGYEEVRRGG